MSDFDLFRRLCCVFTGLLIATPSRADPVLPAIIGDNMVLQAGQPVPIWGRAQPGGKVRVSFGDKTVAGIADAKGEWSVELPALEASAVGATLTVVGNTTIELRNVLVGEVWLCSGQSNMAWTVEDADRAQEEIAAAHHPTIRLFTAPRAVATDGPRWGGEGRWVECAPETVGDFSAVGYFFGRDLQAAIGRPVGLIHSSWGGTKAKVWLPQTALDARPELAVINEAWEKELADFPRAKAEFDAAWPELQADWERRAERARAAGQAPPAEPRLRTGPETQYVPSALYNAMIAPLAPFGLRGFVWYQGESDVGAPLLYQETLYALLASWREAWRLPEAPFVCVQLPNIDRQPEPSRSGWAELRESQLRLLEEPATAVVVTIDIGDPGNIHPTNKQPVGRRVARAAEVLAYGADAARGLSAVPRETRREGRELVVTFDHVAGALRTRGGGAPRGWVVAGANRIFVPATVTLHGDEVRVSSPAVEAPVAVRYAWADNPPANLEDEAGLPVAPFRTDRWATLAIAAHEALR